MYGIQAINAANGWAMAITGAMIVISGLALLSFIISRLHKIIDWMDKPKGNNGLKDNRPDTDRALVIPEKMPSSHREVAGFYQTLTAPLGKTFDLVSLYRLCTEHRIPHPHLTIRTLRDAGLMVPVAGGLFSWNLN
ncbi:MAG: OadG family protein [Desulfobacterales bacterium]|nr:OadG family protein [Desulfobacterales bacterium]